MTEPSFEIRPASQEDLPEVAALAARLVRQHHAFDAKRFMLQEPIEEGYRWWLGRELGNGDAVVLVAVEGGSVLGYAYGRLEERDWNALLDVHGALHDIYVDEPQRRKGVAAALVKAMCDRLAEMGAPRVVLHTASGNASAQALFKKVGFRPTMLEMTRESDPSRG
jgi:ribosomal protein S18 acetylase RimI-like enzyme